MPTMNVCDVNLHYRGFTEFVPLAEKIAAHGIRVLLHDRACAELVKEQS